MKNTELWKADLGNGIYRNPVLHADYSDPDVIRAGSVYYMTASSFHYTPGLPILRSFDLVNWELVNYAVKNIEYSAYSQPQHSKGIWAPAIRLHDGYFYIFYGMPDEGIFMVKTEDPLGEWEKPTLVLEGKGLIDPCPLWDDDGRAYIVHAYAKSRIGFNSVLGIFEITPDGRKAVSEDKIVFDGRVTQPTIEGPKFYKMEEWYYIFAPAGGVKTGWQTVLRSQNIYGPYEERVVMRQGNTMVNGPHQGALVDTPDGEEWFLHFQDKGAYGRVLHLQPVIWHEGWPVIGWEKEGREWGEPCYFHKKPSLPEKVGNGLCASDNFEENRLGLQWQWSGNHEDRFYSLDARAGFLRLYSLNPSGREPVSLWNCANILTQKLLCPNFRMDVRMEYGSLEREEQAGIVVTGNGCAWLGIVRKEEGDELVYAQESEESGEMRETVTERIRLTDEKGHIWFRAEIREADSVTAIFSYSMDGKEYKGFSEPFVLKPHTWVGAKTGIFSVARDCGEHKGYVDFADVKYKNLRKEPELELQLFQAGELDTARYLTEYSKTSLNIRDDQGQTPLHYAVRSGNLELVKYLTERVGLSPTVGDRKGITPYEEAHAKGMEEIEQYFAHVCGAKLDEMYKNPIRRGMYPDPSVIRVGEEYYMVNSSFIYFPAIPISRSKDLIHWKIVGYAIENEEWAALNGLEGGRGYWAPDISASNGRYYITATWRMNDGGTVCRKQIIVSADRPEGPYGEPIWIDEDGIDPSLFHDDDGRHYMLLNRGARILELNSDMTRQISPARLLYYGDCKRAPEGPHLLKKDGWYYLFLAEGGTGMGHQITAARSRSLEKPFVPCPYNPIMRQENPDALLQRCGHGKPVSTPEGNWYMVYLCGRMPDGKHTLLGRETALDPITWTEDGWPIINGGHGPGVLQKKPFPDKESAWDDREDASYVREFEQGHLSMNWVSPRGDIRKYLSQTADGIYLKGDGCDVDSLQARSILLRRQTSKRFVFGTIIKCMPEFKGEAGLICYYDENTWLKFGVQVTEERAALILEENKGRQKSSRKLKRMPEKYGNIRLEIDTDGLRRALYWYEEMEREADECGITHSGDTKKKLAELKHVDYLCDEGCNIGKRFTGPMAGIFVSGEDCEAMFRQFYMKND